MAAALLLLLRLTRQRFHLWFGINMAIGALAVGTRVAAYHFGWDFRSMLAADILWDFLGGATLALFLAGYLELRSAAGLAGDSGAWAGEGGPNAVAVSPSRAEGGRDLFRVWDRGRHAAWAVGVPGLAGTSTPFTPWLGKDHYPQTSRGAVMFKRKAAICLSLGWCLSLPLYSQETTTANLLRKLQAAPSASSAEQQLERRGLTNAADLRLIDARLPKLLSTEKNLNELRTYAKLAGSLRLQSTISPLCQLLTRPTEDLLSTGIYRYMELQNDPFGYALVQIGSPAVGQVSALLRVQDVETRSRAIRILIKIDTPESRAELREARTTEKDTSMKNIMDGYLSRPTETTGASNPN